MSFLAKPSLVHAGANSVVTPDGDIPPDLWAEYAAIVLLEPEPAELEAWIRRLEDHLGVTDFHRAFVEGGDAEAEARSFIAAEQQARGLRPEPGAPKVELPDHERGLAEHDIQRTEVLVARLAKPPTRRGRKSADQAREEDLKELAALEARPALKSDQRWREQSAAETVALAELRGEEVARTKAGAVRINSRDPLFSLLHAGHLTADQYDAGVALRDAYEARGEGLGSQMGGLTSVSSPTYDNSPAVFRGLQRAKALQRIGTVERAVALKCKDQEGRSDPNGLAMLRAVCSQGMALRSQGAGREFERNARSLAAALTIAAEMTRSRQT